MVRQCLRLKPIDSPSLPLRYNKYVFNDNSTHDTPVNIPAYHSLTQHLQLNTLRAFAPASWGACLDPPRTQAQFTTPTLQGYASSTDDSMVKFILPWEVHPTTAMAPTVDEEDKVLVVIDQSLGALASVNAYVRTAPLERWAQMVVIAVPKATFPCCQQRKIPTILHA
jgi:hypothetical protein